MSLRKRVATVAVAVTVAMAGSAIAASPAQATYTDCFSGRFCLWEHLEYGGSLGMYSPTTSCYSMGVMNNAATSLYNRTSRTVRYYDSGNCTGAYTQRSSGQRDGDLRYGDGGQNWNDRISSFKVV